MIGLSTFPDFPNSDSLPLCMYNYYYRVFTLPVIILTVYYQESPDCEIAQSIPGFQGLRQLLMASPSSQKQFA